MSAVVYDVAAVVERRRRRKAWPPARKKWITMRVAMLRKMKKREVMRSMMIDLRRRERSLGLGFGRSELGL